MVLLTKSKYMSGLSCHKKMWRENKKDVPEFHEGVIHRFNQGFDFEKYARKLFNGARYLGDLGFKENIDETIVEIKNRNIILEAGVMVGDFYARCDVLEPWEDGWNLYEIKVSNSVKKYQADDLAFQKFVLESLGLKIFGIFVLHCNSEYYRGGEVEIPKLVKKTEMTDKVNEIENVGEKANELLNVLKMKNVPNHELTSKCKNPFECRLLSECWSGLPEYNIFQLGSGVRNWKFFGMGLIDLELLDVNKLESVLDGKNLSEKDAIVMKSLEGGEPYINRDKIKSFLDSFEYPLAYFDFETFDTGVPIYDRSKTWQKIPFQYSIHVEDKPHSLSYHSYFFPEDDKDPRRKLLAKLKKDIPASGSIVVYNMSFERDRLKELGRDFPEFKEWTDSIVERLVDLAVPFINKDYYHRDLKGKHSIKKILPLLTEEGYDDLNIQDGEIASVKYYNMFLKGEDGDKNKLKNDLIKYCNLDTKAMIDVFYALKRLVS